MVLLSRRRNAIHYGMLQDVKEILAKLESSNNEAGGEVQTFKSNGNLVVPIGKESILKHLSQNQKEDISDGTSSITGYISKIYQVEMNIDSFIDFISKVITNDKELMVYGILIIYGETRINPLHPFIAKAILSKQIVLPEKFNVVVYSLHSPLKINEVKYSNHLVHIANSLLYLSNEVKVREKKLLLTNRNDILTSIDREWITTSRNPLTRDVEVDVLSEGTENVIIPVQKMSTGMTYPYYGLVASTFTSGSYQSINLYPMFSGNVSSTSMRTSSTCVGSLSSRLFSSLEVLADMNIHSMYYPEVIKCSWPSFVYACQEVSLSLLKGLINGKKEKQEGEENDTANNGVQTTNRQYPNVPF